MPSTWMIRWCSRGSLGAKLGPATARKTTAMINALPSQSGQLTRRGLVARVAASRPGSPLDIRQLLFGSNAKARIESPHKHRSNEVCNEEDSGYSPQQWCQEAGLEQVG